MLIEGQGKCHAAGTVDKPEARNQKSERMTKTQMKRLTPLLSDFGLGISFGFLVSGFGFNTNGGPGPIMRINTIILNHHFCQ
jgi:hypothetical protein